MALPPKKADETRSSCMEFPLLFPIKILAKVGSNMEAFVKETLEKELLNSSHIEYTSRLSSHGKYHSVTALFTASNQEELDRVYEALKSHQEILWMI